MARLGAWVKKHFNTKPASKKQSSDKLPFLSPTRRPITPTTFDTPACLFFGLPGDIRRMILTMAFGGRTIHVDVVRQGEIWQWRGAVCNRSQAGLLPSMRYAWRGPLNDSCLNLTSKREEKLESYAIGIMGFLLSCRQAYTEGMEFLYAANCINIQNNVLLLHLPRLILPNRLTSIKTLEVVIKIHRIQQDNARPSLDLGHVKPILDHIVTHCHSLRSICLSFAVQDWNNEILNGPILSLVDAFYASTRLRNMRVELPSEAYALEAYRLARSCKASDDHPCEEPLTGLSQRSLWRSLDGDVPVIQNTSIERYPNPPLKLPIFGSGDERLESAGYWLSEGEEEPIRPYMVCF